MNKRFANKKVLVTGAEGFIGSHLVEALLKEQATVRALVQYNSFNRWGWLEALPDLTQIDVVLGDVRDLHTCRQITKDIDTVFHLAALISIPYSYQAPQSFIETNVKGTANMCQAALDNGCNRFLHTSTSEVYGTACYTPIDEKHPLQPQSPYSASKIGADSIALSYYHAFDLPLTVVRPFNAYGPRQSARAVIPTIIIQIASGKKEIILGDLTTTRDFTFVTDLCEGFLALASDSNSNGEVVNVGSNKEISIQALCEKIASLMEVKIVVIQDPCRIRPINSEVRQLRCNYEKLCQLTSYKHMVSFNDGLRETILWFMNPCNLMQYKAEIYNV